MYWENDELNMLFIFSGNGAYSDSVLLPFNGWTDYVNSGVDVGVQYIDEAMGMDCWSIHCQYRGCKYCPGNRTTNSWILSRMFWKVY
jgi:hypothetical protein